MSALLTSAVISKETLLNFENSLAVANRCSWQYSDEFAKPADQIGNTYTLRKPINVVATEDNMAWNAANSSVQENSVTLFMNRTLTVPMSFSEGDLALKIEKFSDRFIAKAARTIASKLDAAIAQSIVNSTVPGANAGAGLAASGLSTSTAVPNAAGYVVGTYGTALTVDTIAAAKVVLQNQACPDDGEIYGILSTKANSELVKEQASLFNPLLNVDKTYKNGFIGRYNGIEFAMSQSLASHTNGAQGTLAVTAAAGNTIATGWAETATLTVTATGAAVNAGDMFVATGVYLVNPLTKITTSTLAQFQVVTAANSGATSIVVSPAPISAGPYQNISASIASTTLTLVGATGASGVESLIFHKQAIEVASQEFTIPKKSSMDMAESIKDDSDIEGFKIRFLRGYDMIGASGSFGGGVGTGGPGFVSRFDVMYGIKTANPAWIVRLRN